jgi:hypothetical protein
MTIHRPGMAQRFASGPQVWRRVQAASASFVGILDGISNVAAAYSLRQLRSAYSGPAVRVRRSSDSTEQDIGFVAGEFDSSAFSSFVGGGTGYVKTWYDQSGHARDAAQATTGSQPQIVLSAVNSKPAIRFSRTNTTGLRTGDGPFGQDSAISVIATYKLSSLLAGSYNFIANCGNGATIIGSSFELVHTDGAATPTFGIYQSTATSRISTASSSGTTNYNIASGKWSSGNGCLAYRNGNAATASASLSGSINAGTIPLGLGVRGAGTITAVDALDGDIAEIIILSAAVSSADHNTIGNDMATRYGISWTTVT